MKKLTKILLLASLSILIIACMAVTAFAMTKEGTPSGDFSVVNADGSETFYKKSNVEIADFINKLSAETTIKLYRNVDFNGINIVIKPAHSLTVDLNKHLINFNGQNNHLGALTVYGNRIVTFKNGEFRKWGQEGVYVDGGAKCIFDNCLINANGKLADARNGEITIRNNSTFNINYSEGMALFYRGEKFIINVENSTIVENKQTGSLAHILRAGDEAKIFNVDINLKNATLKAQGGGLLSLYEQNPQNDLFKKSKININIDSNCRLLGFVKLVENNSAQLPENIKVNVAKGARFSKDPRQTEATYIINPDLEWKQVGNEWTVATKAAEVVDIVWDFGSDKKVEKYIKGNDIIPLKNSVKIGNNTYIFDVWQENGKDVTSFGKADKNRTFTVTPWAEVQLGQNITRYCDKGQDFKNVIYSSASGAVLKLLKDASVSTTGQIEINGKNITVDLNNKSFTTASRFTFAGKTPVLTFKNGYLKTTKSELAFMNCWKATLNLEGVKLESARCFADFRMGNINVKGCEISVRDKFIPYGYSSASTGNVTIADSYIRLNGNTFFGGNPKSDLVANVVIDFVNSTFVQSKYLVEIVGAANNAKFGVTVNIDANSKLINFGDGTKITNVVKNGTANINLANGATVNNIPNVSKNTTLTLGDGTSALLAKEDGTYCVAPKLLKGDVYLNLDRNINLVFLSAKNGEVIFELNGNRTTVKGVEQGDKFAYKFEAIDPRYMGDVITITQNNEQVATMSIKEYAQKVLELYKDKSTQTLIKDVLVYGAQSQLFTNYKTSSLVSSDEIRIVDLNTVANGATVKNSDIITFVGANARLCGTINLNLEFAAKDISSLTLKVTINGREKIYTKDDFIKVDNKENTYKIVLEDIMATEFGKTITVLANGKDFVSYSLNSYLKALLNNNEVQNLAKAIIAYGDSACNYYNAKHEKNPEKLFFRYPGYAYKAVTFTIDDGIVATDRKFIDIVKKYGIKGTFNLISNRMDSMTPEEYREFYKGYGISNHCKYHPYVFEDGVEYKISKDKFDPKTADVNFLYQKDSLPGHYWFHTRTGWREIVTTETYIKCVEEGKAEIEKIFGEGTVKEFVWPYGQRNNAKVKEYLINSGLQSIRKVGCMRDVTNFALPRDRMAWSYNADDTNLVELMNLYNSLEDDGTLKFFAVGIHSEDFENHNKWGDLEYFAQTFAKNKQDYWSASVSEIFDYEDAVKSATVTENSITNNSDITIYTLIYGLERAIAPHETVEF